jgi:hypothetical protein
MTLSSAQRATTPAVTALVAFTLTKALTRAAAVDAVSLAGASKSVRLCSLTRAAAASERLSAFSA